jgi:hypothetical protein
MDSDRPAIYAGPEDKRAWQSTIQATGSGSTLSHVLFDGLVRLLGKKKETELDKRYYLSSSRVKLKP